MNNITKGVQRILHSILYSVCFFIVIVLFGCKKDQTVLTQTSSDLSAAKADIVVHAGESIQAAVDVSKAGMLILIEPGIYSESITVDKAGIKLVGLSKNGNNVIIQNPGDEEDGISVTDAGDGFVLKNVTIQNFEENGVLLDSVDNFIISHVTARNNGEYGIFPVFSLHGIIDHCMVTGHTDTGLYVGQSSDVTMEYNTATANVNGLEVENSSDVRVVNNHSFDNVCGMLIDLLPGKKIKTSNNVYVGHNYVHNNNHLNFGEDSSLEAVIPSGLGILVLGADAPTIENNIVRENNFSGITVFSSLILVALGAVDSTGFDVEPNPDNIRINKNIVERNGTNPPPALILPGVDLLWDGSGTNNCWNNNHFETSYPSPLPSCE
jgi:parallel beta-helix repeat protein